MKHVVALILCCWSFGNAQAQSCTWDSDCQAGYYCNDATGLCRMGRWPDGGCTWDSDCLSGYECEDGECLMGGGCTWDSDCLAGYYCNDATGQCRMGRWPDGGCTWDSDCLTGYECGDDGECVWVDDRARRTRARAPMCSLVVKAPRAACK